VKSHEPRAKLEKVKKVRNLILGIVFLSLLGCGSAPLSGPIDFSYAPLKPGGDNKLSEIAKDKPVLIYIWATWCGPCKQFAPVINAISDKYGAKGVVCLAIANDKATDVRKSEATEPHTGIVGIDEIGLSSNALQSNGLPTIAVLNKSHEVVFISQGFSQTTPDEVAAALDGVL
jgi:thiol-disulfide isomerase/thioredoxin